MKEGKIVRGIKDKDYRESSGLNYSLLSSLNRHPSTVDLDKDVTPSLSMGKLIDILCFTPKTFKDEFYTSNVEHPSDNIKNIIDIIIERDDCPNDLNSISNVEEFERLIYLTANTQEYGKNWKPETVVNKVRDKGESYFLDKLSSKGKIIVSPEDLSKAEEAALCLMSHPFTKNYFNEPPSHIEILYQVGMFFDIEIPVDINKTLRTKGKALIDILIINHKTKTVFPIDLKTIGTYTSFFPKDFIKWNYYLQAAFYSYGISQIKEFEDYNVANFKFIVISTQDRSRPVIYTCTDRDLDVGHNGTTSLYGSRIKGWKELVKEYFWHKKNDKWDYTYEIYENNGHIKLDVFNLDHLKE